MERMKRKERKKIKKDKEAKINGKLVCVKGATILYVYLCTVCVSEWWWGGRVIYHWTNAGLWGVLVEVGVSRGRALSARMVLLLK